jgi:hypothetical protein
MERVKTERGVIGCAGLLQTLSADAGRLQGAALRRQGGRRLKTGGASKRAAPSGAEADSG